jgi:type IV pilus assembly protein PilO
MTLDDINKLDFKTVADWPLGAKLGLLAIGFVAIVGAGWWFLWKPSLQELEKGQRKEQELRASFTTKKGQAVNLEAYKKQLSEIQQSFGALLKQLPNKQEMDALITDVNQAGLGRGLQFELFKPETEKKSEFYAELPIKIKVMGGYHDIASFTSDVAKLSRIVTLHDITIQPDKEGVLVMDTVARTYRYLDDEEINSAKKASEKDKKSKKSGGKKK